MVNELREKYDEEQRSNAKLQEDMQRLRQHYEEEMQTLNTQTDAKTTSTTKIAVSII